nr:serine/threonine kinase [Pithovirus mammoth]
MVSKGQLLLSLVLICFYVREVHSVGARITGTGSEAAGPIFSSWKESYQAYREDVTVELQAMPEPDASAASFNIDYNVFSGAIPREVTEIYEIGQFPIAGQALVIVCNLPGIPLDANHQLVIDRPTLAAIWVGNITMWNDTRLQQLNPNISLPAQNIRIGYDDGFYLSSSEVVKLFLSQISPAFDLEFQAAGRMFSGLRPTLEGRGFSVGNSSPKRRDWMKSEPYSLTYCDLTDIDETVRYMRMINVAGNIVSPSFETVQAGMRDYTEAYAVYNLTVNMIDAPGNNSWPMIYVLFYAMSNNFFQVDCTRATELMNFVAWTVTNNQAARIATSHGFVPLENSLIKRVIDELGTVKCNGQRSFNTEFLVGIGSPMSIITTWASLWTSSATKIKYYDSTSDEAKNLQLKQSGDFGVSINGIEDNYLNLIPDMKFLPIASFAVVPAFNIPTMIDFPLIMTVEIAADIYLGQITNWNDSRIRALNPPEIQDLLPNETIRVVVHDVDSDMNWMLTNFLSSKVPAFEAQVGRSRRPVFPSSSFSSTLFSSDLFEVGNLMLATPFTFAFWSKPDVSLISRHTQVKSVVLLQNDGSTLNADNVSLARALDEFVDSSQPLRSASVIMGTRPGSWPLISLAGMVYRSESMEDCSKAEALADFMYWSLSDPASLDATERQSYLRTSQNAHLRSTSLNLLKEFSCHGVTISSVSNCINEGEICSARGSCNDNSCLCLQGYTGQFCQDEISSGSSDSTLPIALGVVIPVCVGVLLLLLCFILVLLFVLKRKGRSDDAWEIRPEELQIGEELGSGGYGTVHKAIWKGTEVAVKMMNTDRITKDMEKNFKEEVRVMTSLRHPNVVLFMAASTKPPKMCIVMEYMTLGSLFDLLHNELIPEIPFALKVKMAYQASKGMHFLHSSGIVHRDMKSLNLLLDNKWNVKVSDFGLTKFRDELQRADVGTHGSVHWVAPEVLNETPGVDLILADVYSFGIILWELLTREQPYFGMSPVAVAVAVLRDGIRPRFEEEEKKLCKPEYAELITNCWHSDPTIRPTFLEIMTRLSQMNGDSSTSHGATSTSQTSSTASHASGNSQGTSGLVSLTGNSLGSDASSNNSYGKAVAKIPSPDGEVTLVFSDITRAASLWEFNPTAMRDATLLHNEVLRSILLKHRGYEVVFLRERNNGEGSFCMAFQHPQDALKWCVEVQKALLEVEWPAALLEHPGAAEEWGDTDDRILFRGLRVRMGVHLGFPRISKDPTTRKIEYTGLAINIAARITSITHGGQIIFSHEVFEKLPSIELAAKKVLPLGKFDFSEGQVKLYEMKADGLDGRFFGGVTHKEHSDHEFSHTYSDDGSGRSARSDRDLQSVVGEGMMFKEDTFLTSANLCRWIIDFNEISLGKQIGLGSYGVVFHGKWKGVEIAVKRFIKQKLDEKRLLEFRAEMAMLSELHHPNIVLFIGACVKKPNLCIVTEFLKQGNLKDLLGSSAKLSWKQKMKILHGAALGVNYLHSLTPTIVHRDLKPSNLLIDNDANITKVADFGFARIKEENATMTRCGTPCWTAPEIIRGEKYDEKVDVFSFGIIMWQVVTRKEPFAGRNFMGVSLDVLEGKRPQIPEDCPQGLSKLIRKCWHAQASKRPSMEEVVEILSQQYTDEDENFGNRV